MTFTQLNGGQIIERARVFAQDNAANSNFAVSDADALILLNDILVSYQHNFKTKPKWLSASTTGLTFTAGVASLVTTDDLGVSEIESFHQSSSSGITYPLSPAIERVSVQEILELFDSDGTTTPGARASEWTHVAAEKSMTDTTGGGSPNERWRIWAFPVIDQTHYMHLRVPGRTYLANGGEHPDLDLADALIVSRLLAYEMAKLKKETTQAFLENILSGVPKEILGARYGVGLRGAQLQDNIVQRWS